MTRYLVTWKAVGSRFSENTEARVKQQMTFLQNVQEALKSGALKDWGTSPSGQKGYAVFEGSETAMSKMAQLFDGYFEFEESVVLTADQFMEVLKSA